MIQARSGYDGEFYYRLALDPFTDQKVEYGIAIDDPPYRQQRILYPILARLLALGVTSWIPLTLIAVNYLAVCGLAFNAARLAELFAMPAIFGLTVAFYPSILFALARDLPDTLAISLMVFSLYLLLSRRTFFSACILALAVLARDTVIVLIVSLIAHAAWRAIHKQSPWTDRLALAIPFLTYVAWQLWIFANWKAWPSGPAGLLLGIPLKGLGILLEQALRPKLNFYLLELIELLLLVAIVVFAATALVRSEVDPGIKLAWLLYLTLAVCLSNTVWAEDWSFMRGTEELIVLGLIVLIGARARQPLSIALVATLAIWMALAARTIIAV